MSEFAPICIYLVISPLVSLIPLGVPFPFASIRIYSSFRETSIYNRDLYPISIVRKYCSYSYKDEKQIHMDYEKNIDSKKKKILNKKEKDVWKHLFIPLLFLALVFGGLYILCVFFDYVPFFQMLIERVSFSLGRQAISRAIFKCFSGNIALAVDLVLSAAFIAGVAQYMLPDEGTKRPHPSNSGEKSESPGAWADSLIKSPSPSATDQGQAAGVASSSGPEQAQADKASGSGEKSPSATPEPSTDRTPGHLPQGGGAPGQPAGEREPEAPTIDELITKMRLVLRGHRKLRSDVLKKIKEDIRLETASPQKRMQINAYLDDVSKNRDSL